ncbi:MAG: Immunity protein 35 [Labilithrix sp.]|nr:Immunity protein 35 [Labilithrix sp.]
MITRGEAEKTVLDVHNVGLPSDPPRAVVLDAWARPYGWIVFYDSETYLRTGDAFDRFFGNGPQVVMHDGRVFVLGTARGAEEEIAAFERDVLQTER